MSAKKNTVSFSLCDHLTVCREEPGGRRSGRRLLQVRGDIGLNKKDSSQGNRGGRWEKYFGMRTDITR